MNQLMGNPMSIVTDPDTGQGLNLSVKDNGKVSAEVTSDPGEAEKLERKNNLSALFTKLGNIELILAKIEMQLSFMTDQKLDQHDVNEDTF